MSDKSEKLFDFKFLEDDLVIFGAEFSGIPEEILELCEVFLKIPAYGITQSLNISHTV